jgi:hypothetical protein
LIVKFGLIWDYWYSWTKSDLTTNSRIKDEFTNLKMNTLVETWWICIENKMSMRWNKYKIPVQGWTKLAITVINH